MQRFVFNHVPGGVPSGVIIPIWHRWATAALAGNGNDARRRGGDVPCAFSLVGVRFDPQISFVSRISSSPDWHFCSWLDFDLTVICMAGEPTRAGLVLGLRIPMIIELEYTIP
jgi:hypothetical protein